MRLSFTVLLAAALLASHNAVSSQDTLVDTHEVMVGGVSPAAMAIWDVGSTAMREPGMLDQALMDAAAWRRLEDAARRLDAQSRRIAEAGTLHVGAHNDALQGYATRAEIQQMIDGDPDGFRALAATMAVQAADLASAAAARDLRQAGALMDTLGERCSACHSRYWERPAD